MDGTLVGLVGVDIEIQIVAKRRINPLRVLAPTPFAFKEKYIVSVAFIKEKEMRGLNKKYLNKNKPTDVLSFPETKDFMGKIKEFENILGEVVICPKFIKKNAKKLDFSFKKELSRVLIHGILHLLGYGHEKSEQKAKEMKGKENYYLSPYF